MGVTAVAVSGGVDSLIAAYLLKQQGREVIGIHFLTGYETSASMESSEVGSPASYIEKVLSIPVITVDLRQEFRSQVVDYFICSYHQGRTPNPCLVCNSSIKFDVLLSLARHKGADTLATGHYVRLINNNRNQYQLLKGADVKKDQSYFLAFVPRDKLPYLCFPLGTLQKTAIQAMALEKGLRGFHLNESQDICFIRHCSYGSFLAQQADFVPQPGPITDLTGKLLGTHQGLHLFTVGQRKGINCPAEKPYYVIRLDIKQNRLVVGFKQDLRADSFTVSRINWMIEPPPQPFEALVKIRYRSAETPAVIIPEANQRAEVKLKGFQEAVTPGQGAVFYQGQTLLGGGWIDG